MTSIPRVAALDSTPAFLREGYPWLGNRCRDLGSDMFETRLMGRRVLCMMGEEAARRFYDGKSLSRVGAMPPTTLRLLQDKGSVQALDGAAHAHRKQLFLDLLAGDAPESFADIFERRWRAALPEWRGRSEITLHEAAVRLLCEAALEWCGIAVAERDVPDRAEELAAMVAGAGAVGPKLARGLWLRRRAEHWARDQIDRVRRGLPARPDSPLARIAEFRDLDGAPLTREEAGVELLNLLRPIVAIARFVTFAALALHEHGDAAEWLESGPGEVRERQLAFVQEVRRFYPFFPVIGGRVRSAFEWRGNEFADGDWVLLGLHATNHDARLWPEPQRFDPARFLRWQGSGYDLIPQGAGEYLPDHRCPGEWMTIAVLRRALALLRIMPGHLPEQDLRVPLDRFPTLPNSSVRIAFDR
ncbi:cytochrome P450 [Sphingosinithalassobacter sp. LHW66-3]|uniref:cytochrome P450 n=1 Tax=Sphingosinithalassobacter sp. LHW66-3 TaxID=3424718 RepID=UPI003D6C4156